MKPERMNSRLLLSIFSGLIIFGVVAIFFWEFLRETIVLPIYRFAIILRYGINSVPQFVFLFLIVIIGFILAIRALHFAFEKDAGEEQSGNGYFTSYSASYSSRYRYWKMQTAPLGHSEFARNDFVRNTRRLVLELIAHQQHRTWLEVETLAMDGQVSLPPMIEELVCQRTLRRTPRKVNFFIGLYETISKRFGVINDRPDPVLDEHINAILQFIEERLEINHDESNL